MKYAVDLHIHSALSPCASNDMTPNNIVNMALIKGLDIIAVCDHNSAENAAAFQECAKGSNLLVVPGMELETSEEVHLVCLLPDTESVMKLQEKVYASLPHMQNREDVFGSQYIFDVEDKVKGKLDRLLLVATGLHMQEVFSLVDELGGVAIPAHVDRSSYSVISNLGFIPEDMNIKYVEVSRDCDVYDLTANNPGLEKYRFIKSSDAHTLGDILERETFLELDELSVECLILKLKYG